ncbi:hypothetical protein CAPTEDRAFT_134057, partial [Capitella teleta]
SQNDCLKLQYDLDKLLSWSKKWDINFNASKCKVLSVSIIFIKNHPLSKSNSIYLLSRWNNFRIC